MHCATVHQTRGYSKYHELYTEVRDDFIVARPKTPEKVKRPKVVCIFPYGNGLSMTAYSVTYSNVLTALLTRMFLVDYGKGFERPPEVQKEAVRRLYHIQNKIIKEIGRCEPWTKERFLSTYSGRKLKRYQDASEVYEMHGVSRSDAIVNTFSKKEKQMMCMAGKKKNFNGLTADLLTTGITVCPDPRAINSRKYVYHYALGRYIKCFEHQMFKTINKQFGEVVVMKGHNMDSRGDLIAQKWFTYQNPVAVGLDAKRFDQHVRPEMLRYEHRLYNMCFRSKELSRLLSMQVVNKGVYYGDDGYIKYRKNGCRMSGDMNTGMGNVQIMCAMVWTYMSSKKIQYSFINDGDDCVLIMDHYNLHKINDLKTEFLKWGFYMEVEKPVYELELLEFCQARPIQIATGHWRMVRDPRVCLTKDTMSLRAEWNNPINIDQYRNAIGQCGLALCSGVPVMQSFYQAMRRGVEHMLPPKSYDYDQGMYRVSRGMKIKQTEPTVEARTSFNLAFGVSVDEQIELERYYEQITHISTIAVNRDFEIHPNLEYCDGFQLKSLNGVRERNPTNVERLQGDPQVLKRTVRQPPKATLGGSSKP